MLPSKELMERARLASGLVASGLLFALLVAGILFPAAVADAVRSRLSAAGFELEKLNLPGAELRNTKTAIETLQAEVSVARSEIGRLELENNDLREKLKSAGVLIQSTVDPAVDATLQSRLDSAVRNAEETLRVLSDADPVAAKVEGNRAWIVVLGADRSLGPADFELAKVKRASFDGGILSLDGFYRTVAYFGSKAAASEALRTLATLMGREGYVREFNAWCPGAVATDNPDLIQCS